MKKKALVAGLSSLAAISTAHAQSSVTLYGIFDEGFEYVTNVRTSGTTGKSLYQLDATSGLQGSRWGLRGAEDLGGGMKAIFVLENGFDGNTGRLGQGGALFGRQSYVGISSQFGTVTAGRQYDSVVDYVGIFGVSDQWASHRGAHPGDLDNLNNSARTNNSVKYASNTIGGFTFGGLYSFGGQAGDFTRNQVFSVGAAYNNGPLALGVGYLNVRNPNVSFFGNNPNGGGVTANNISPAANPVISGYASAHTYQVVAAGAAYTIGAATLGATYSNTRFLALGNTGASGPSPQRYTGDATFNNVEVNAKYQITPAWLVGVAYDYTKGNGADSTLATIHNDGVKYHQFALGTDYSLTKRTDVYIFGIYQKASGVDSTGQEAVASITGLTAAAVNHAALVRAGLRVKF
ncbi:porin [Caballeronia novacaledonica]|uniref:Porin n=1 Tax=Caballeronia novacaledonica TaxID=1544861 RepID=A0AA37MJD0_9BURK|nr:porin [Caballeronia novacaledonica]GJH29353.1 porin [Caballeronia novacaledonica]